MKMSSSDSVPLAPPDNATSGRDVSAGGLIDVLFRSGLDGDQIGFAMGEAIAHLNYLLALGHFHIVEDGDSVRSRRVGSCDLRITPALN